MSHIAVGCCHLLWRELLGDTWNNDTILNGSLDEPMFLSIASHTSIHASFAEVEITLLTDTAMVVFIWHGLSTVIAIDAVRGRRKLVQQGHSGQAEEVTWTGLDNRLCSGRRLVKSTWDCTPG